jgi:DNA-binding SARP family transcriptional activator
MPDLYIHLFGKFSVRQDDRPATGFDAHKEQELLSYLLLHRNRPHSREALAGLIWGDVSTEKSKKYLRQALWHIQAALDSGPQSRGVAVLAVEHDWVQLNARAELWLDVEIFERTFMLVHDLRGADLDAGRLSALQAAVQIYRGDLLEGWYQDWCLYERERLQNIYLVMLDKLMCFCEAEGKFELGLHYGSLVLRYDRAHERTHRQLMNFQYLSGDRTGALRQFERCSAALREELGVKPDKLTSALYHKIRADQGDTSPPAPAPAAPSLADVLGHLQQIQAILAELQKRSQKEISRDDLSLNDPAG